MAGGAKQLPPPTPGSSARRRLSTVQFLLLAALIGLLIGVVAGLISLVI